MDMYTKEVLKTALIVLSSVLFVILVIYGVIKADEATRWNQGYCKECRIGKMDYFDCTCDSYIYKCDNCGSMIRLYEFK